MRITQIWSGLLGCLLLASVPYAAFAAPSSKKASEPKTQSAAKSKAAKEVSSKTKETPAKNTKTKAAKDTAKDTKTSKSSSKSAKTAAKDSKSTKIADTKASKSSPAKAVASKPSAAAPIRVAYSRPTLAPASGARALSILENRPPSEPVSFLDAEGNLALQSQAFLVKDLNTGGILLERNANVPVPIASITKLMTAMVALDANLNLSEEMEIGEEDVDRLKNTRSRLTVGTRFVREEMMRLALMSSENRAASALSRYYPGGRPAFIAAMNKKAIALGMHDSRFFDSSGLDKRNVSSPRDLANMVAAASHYPLIRELSTSTEFTAEIDGRVQKFHNTNPLVGSTDWQIGLSKTGFINESGKCLVMQAWFQNRPVAIVLMDSSGKATRVGDAQRIRKWIETSPLRIQDKVASSAR